MDYLLATIIIRNGDFKLLRISSTIGTFLGGEKNSSVDTIFQRTSWFDLRNHQKNPTTLQLQGWLSKAFNKDFQRINIKRKPAAVDTFNISSFDIFIWNLNCLYFVKKCLYILRTPFFYKPLELHFHDKWCCNSCKYYILYQHSIFSVSHLHFFHTYQFLWGHHSGIA